MSSDPREVTTTVHGTPLRDAAVDPEATDFLPPINAGLPGEEGNPHGPNVIAPGIHASNQFRPVRPGPVDSDPETQSEEESAHASEHLYPTAETPDDPDPETSE